MPITQHRSQSVGRTTSRLATRCRKHGGVGYWASVTRRRLYHVKSQVVGYVVPVPRRLTPGANYPMSEIRRLLHIIAYLVCTLHDVDYMLSAEKASNTKYPRVPATPRRLPGGGYMVCTNLLHGVGDKMSARGRRVDGID